MEERHAYGYLKSVLHYALLSCITDQTSFLPNKQNKLKLLISSLRAGEKKSMKNELYVNCSHNS